MGICSRYSLLAFVLVSRVDGHLIRIIHRRRGRVSQLHLAVLISDHNFRRFGLGVGIQAKRLGGGGRGRRWPAGKVALEEVAPDTRCSVSSTRDSSSALSCLCSRPICHLNGLEEI